MKNSSVTIIDNADDISFDAIAVADDTNDALAIQVRDTDAGGDVVIWHGAIRASSVVFA